MSKKLSNTETSKARQKRLQILLFAVVFLTMCAFCFFRYTSHRSEAKNAHVTLTPPEPVQTVSQGLDPAKVRITQIETKQEESEEMLNALIANQQEIKEKVQEVSIQNEQTALKNAHLIQEHLESFRKEIKEEVQPKIPDPDPSPAPVQIVSLDCSQEEDIPHVTGYIPAGTVVRCVLVSAADCSVGVQTPQGPAKMLLRPLNDGKLPRKVRVNLKDSIILGSANGNLANERVYVRAERMTLVKPNGDFVETEISAYVSGEDGREGIRGVVVDRSGSIIARAAFASILQGIGQGLESALNNQTIQKISKVGDSKTILDADVFRSAGFKGGSTAFNKLSEYYIKRAEQLQPSIQVAAGRIIDLIFTRGVKIGEKDIRKKIAIERAISKRKKKNEK